MKKVLTVVGARPQFIKASSVSRAFQNHQIEEVIVNSGQHYDYNMSDVFWHELKIPPPKYNLEVGSDTHAAQTAKIMISLEEILMKHEKGVDYLLVYGDTNTSLAGALVASKLNIPIIHVEAGLRSFNNAMPEEVNRILIDHCSSVLFCTSQKAVKQLKNEGINNKVYDVGDVMLDSFLFFTKSLNLKNREQYYLLTIHRPSNTDNKEKLQELLRQLENTGVKVIWPLHPRLKNSINGLKLGSNVEIVQPMSYFDMVKSIMNCSAVITDSGGIQKEAYWAKKKCVTIRNDTEWVETLEGGWNSLFNPLTMNLEDYLNDAPKTKWEMLYGNGDASIKIAQVVKSL